MDSQSQSNFKKITFFISLSLFFILLSYPLVRSASTALFYEHYSANDYSYATFIGVVALMVLIFMSNKLQGRIGAQHLYFLTSLLSIFTLAGSLWGLQMNFKPAAYILFATKEAYIVLLVHSCLAYANAYYSLINLKKFIGPIGAIGSIGGILGGQLTTWIVASFGTNALLWTSFSFIIISAAFFYGTRSESIKGLKSGHSITPLQAIRGVRKYILLIGAVVALSQFVIYLADLQFNIVFEKTVTTKDARASYLGNFYTIINTISLVIQFVVMPILLPRLSLRNIFIFIPAFYMILVISGFGIPGGALSIIAAVFIIMKGVDYSLFAATKDVMYHPLLSLQKYGAKYITDMFVYRTSKALIAFAVAQITIINVGALASLQFVFLALWIVTIIYLFEEQKKIKKE